MEYVWSRSTPWRQGKVLKNTSVVDLRLNDGDSDTMVIVITHDCDLTQPPEIEPVIEVIIGRLIEQSDFNGNYGNAKNARKLHLEIHGEHKLFLELEATKKQSINKSSLKNHQPALCELSDQSKITLGRWLAKRYRRSAFPDEFENRLRSSKLDKKISSAVKSSGEYIPEIYFDILNLEAIDGEPYQLNIVILYNTEHDADTASCVAEELKNKIKVEFTSRLYDEKQDRWTDIELRYIDVVSDEALTYRQSQTLKSWRLEHISLGANPQQPISEE